MREPGPLSLKRLLVPAGWSFGGTASLAAGEQRQERGLRAPGGSVVIWPIAGARMPFPPLPCQIAGDAAIQATSGVLHNCALCEPLTHDAARVSSLEISIKDFNGL